MHIFSFVKKKSNTWKFYPENVLEKHLLNSFEHFLSNNITLQNLSVKNMFCRKKAWIKGFWHWIHNCFMKLVIRGLLLLPQVLKGESILYFVHAGWEVSVNHILHCIWLRWLLWTQLAKPITTNKTQVNSPTFSNTYYVKKE